MDAHPYKRREAGSKQPDYVTFIGKDQYEVDLVKLDKADPRGEGAFPCPKCGVVIDPEDNTGEIYRIVEVRRKNEEVLQMVLKCNKCKSIIKLTGFQYFETEEKK
jgi:uncharacterized C2H2 Zn-finger protein